MGQGENLSPVESPGGGEVEILDDRSLAEAGDPHPTRLFSRLAEIPFPVQKQPESFLKGEFSVGGILHLLPEPVAHPGEFQGAELVEDGLD